MRGTRHLKTYTSLALISATLSQNLYARKFELRSETLSWLFLLLIFKGLRRRHYGSLDHLDPSSQNPLQSASLQLWGAAICISLCSLYRATIGITSLFPLVGPLLLAFVVLDNASKTCHYWPFRQYMWLNMAAASFITTVLLFNNGVNMRSLLSAIETVAQVLLYALVLPQDVSRWKCFSRIGNFEDIAGELARRITPILGSIIGLEIFAFGLTVEGTSVVILTALLKAATWYFISQTTQRTTWAIAPFIQTTAILFNYMNIYPSSMPIEMLLVLSSFFSLSQVVFFLPSSLEGRRRLWLLLFVPLITFVHNNWTIENQRLVAQLTYATVTNHPIEIMIQRGEVQFKEMLLRKSTTFGTAEETYRRKYTVNPPHGFEAWFEFAMSQNTPIIDDYDTLYRSISPLWQISGKAVTENIRSAYAEPESDLWLCEFKCATGKTSCRHAWRKFDRHIGLMFNTLLGGQKGVIPDVIFLVNHLDEPRVVRSPISNFTDLSHRATWSVLTESCADSSVNKGQQSSMETFGLPFVASQSGDKDLCQHSEYRYMHGLFQSPTSFRPMPGLVPVLSTGSPSTMGDILFPSPAYLEDDFLYTEEKDVEWENKKNNVYWAGSTTGGYAKNDDWRNFHRQRFVALTQGTENFQHAYLRIRDGVLKRVEGSFLNIRLFDVSFTRIFQCEPKSCRDQGFYFRTKTWADKHRAFRSRFAFDLDGNGISGRYYQLLASKSVPLKQTLLREWHDDRLVPWVHYIPISQSMAELPELVSYFIWSENGQKKAKEIAARGREWHSRALREIDMGIYLHRMLLELARLQDVDRQEIM